MYLKNKCSHSLSSDDDMLFGEWRGHSRYNLADKRYMCVIASWDLLWVETTNPSSSFSLLHFSSSILRPVVDLRLTRWFEANTMIISSFFQVLDTLHSLRLLLVAFPDPGGQSHFISKILRYRFNCFNWLCSLRSCWETNTPFLLYTHV